MASTTLSPGPLASGSTYAPAVRPGRLQRLRRDLLVTLLPALLIALGAFHFIARPATIRGTSMSPTLAPGARLVVDQLSYRFAAPQVGDVVVIDLPTVNDRPLIKRVIATAGDRIRIQGGVVFLNGRALAEPYLRQPTAGRLAERVVPAGYVFVLGDNRANSTDSRRFGLVPADRIVGRAALTLWPPDHAGPLP